MIAIAPTPEIIRTKNQNVTILESDGKLFIQYLTDTSVNYYRMLGLESSGLKYYDNSENGWKVDYLGGHFPEYDYLVLNHPEKLGDAKVIKNSNATGDYGTIIMDVRSDGGRTELVVDQYGVHVAKINPNGTLDKNVVIATF